MDAIEADLRRPGFRGCAFNNASIEYDPAHPADGTALGGQLAVLVGGAYTSAAHLGPDGPAADGLRLARHVMERP